MILHELEMGYIHEYLRLISARIIDLIKNYNHNFEEINKYESILIELLGLVQQFFSFNLYSENFLHYFVIHIDELFQLMIYSDNFELINQISLSLKVNTCTSLSSLSIQRLQFQSKYIFAFIEKFIFADLSANGQNPYYEFFAQDEKFLQLKKEADGYFDYQINNKPFYDDSDTLKITLNLKNDNKKLEISNFTKNYHKEMPSFLIAQQIIKKNGLANLQETDFESFVKLVYSIKFKKLQNDPKKGIYHLINCNVLTYFRDYISWLFDPSKKDYGCETFNRNHYAFLVAPRLCLNDEKTLKRLLLSFRLAPINCLAKGYKSKTENEFYQYLSKKIVEIANEILKVYPDNYEIINLAFEQLIYSGLIWTNGSKNDFLNDFQHFFTFLDEFFDKYFIKNEKLQNDPISLLCDRNFKRIFSFFLSAISLNFPFPNLEFYFEEINKIIHKTLEFLIFTNDNLLKKYPKILVFESNYEEIVSFLQHPKNTRTDNIEKLFQGIFQKILQKIKNDSKNSRTFDFYRYFLERFVKYYDPLLQGKMLPEEKQALYDIIEEFCLIRNQQVHAELHIFYKTCLFNDMKNYTTQEDLEKNEQDLKNMTNTIRIELRMVMICNEKKSYVCSSTMFWPFLLLVKKELIQYFEDFHEKIVKKDLRNLPEALKTLSSDPKDDRLYKNYLVFMLFKATKIKTGFLVVWKKFKMMNNGEMMEDEFFTLADSFAAFTSNPLVVGLKDKNQRFSCDLNFSNEGKTVNCDEINLLLQKMVEHCDKFEISYKRLMEITKKKDILLIDFLSNKRKLTHHSVLRKSNWEYVIEFLADAYKKINDAESLEDLQNVAKMKFFLSLLKSGMMWINPKSVAENYYKFFEKTTGIIVEMISGFAKEYLQSQILEYEELFRKNDLYDHSVISASNSYNVVYEMISKYSDFDYKALFQTYKIIKRIYNLPKKLYYFNKYRLSEFDTTNREKFDKIHEQLSNKILQSYIVDVKPQNLNYYEASEIFIKNVLLSNFLKVYFENNAKSRILKKSKFLKKTSLLNENVMEYLKINAINFDLCKNNVGPKQITNELFSKITLLHICLINFKIHSSLLQIIIESVNKRSEVKLKKIEKKLPFYRAFLRALGEQAILFERSEFASIIPNSVYCEGFGNNEDGRKCRKNLAKMNFLLAEEEIVYIMKMKNELPCYSSLFNILRPIFGTYFSDTELEKKHRKYMFLKLTGVFQKMIDDLGGKFKLNEACSLIKECEKDLLGQDLTPFEFEVNDFKLLSPLKQVQIFNFIMYTYVSIADFTNYSPDINKGHKAIYTNNIMVKNFIDLVILMKEKLIQANEFEKGKNIIFEILSYAVLSFEENFLMLNSQENQNKYDCYLENLQLVKKIYEVYCDNKEENYHDPASLFKIMISMLGDIDIKENLEKTQIIVKEIQDIMLGMRDNYFGNQNIMYICLILEKLIIFHDENENLQKSNIELKIKEAFYDQFLTQPKKSLRLEEFHSNQDVADQFILNGKLFYDVFNNICKISDDKEKLHLRDGIGLLFFLNKS